jgi:hypothetical protein
LLTHCAEEGPPLPLNTDPIQSDFVDGETGTARILKTICAKSGAQFTSRPDPIVAKGQLASGAYFAEGGGCLTRPLREAWAALQSGPAVKWKDASLNDFKSIPTNEVDFNFLASYQAGPFFAPQHWEMEWQHSLKEGSLDHPRQVRVRYYKVPGLTKHIRHWQGTLDLTWLSEKITAVAIHNEIRGTLINEEKAAGGLVDILENLKSKPPNWTWLAPSP